MTDTFSTHAAGLDSPYEDGEAVTPSDAADLAVASRALYISVAGTLRVTTLRGTVLNIPVAVAGYHRLRVTRVHATGTLATGILAYY